MKISVERVFGPDLAKASVPRRFFSLGGSSTMNNSRHLACTSKSRCTPNCAMKPFNTRKKRRFVEVADADQLVEAVDAVRRPGPICFHDKIALRCFELHAEHFRHDDFLGRLAARSQKDDEAAM